MLRKLIITRTQFILLSTLLFLCSCTSSLDTHSVDHSVASGGYMIYLKPNTTKPRGWGYEIYFNGAPFISQVTIPAINGNVAFSSKRDAESVAELVVKKMKSGRPPSIQRTELDSLGILIKLNQ